jgi:hypothetical protein
VGLAECLNCCALARVTSITRVARVVVASALCMWVCEAQVLVGCMAGAGACSSWVIAQLLRCGRTTNRFASILQCDCGMRRTIIARMLELASETASAAWGCLELQCWAQLPCLAQLRGCVGYLCT